MKEMIGVVLIIIVVLLVVGGCVVSCDKSENARNLVTCIKGGYTAVVYQTSQGYLCVRTVDGVTQYAPVAVVESQIR